MKFWILLLCIVVVALVAQSIFAQSATKNTVKSTGKNIGQVEERSLLWEVSGNGLAKPSYIFGTFHLMKSYYIDSFKIIRKKFRQCKAMVGELDLNDTTGFADFMESTKLKDTTLEKLYSPQEYAAMNEAFHSLTKMNLKSFDLSTPMYVEAMAMQMIFPKVFPEFAKRRGQAMDMYFQTWAKEDGIPIMGLESIGSQAQLLFSAIPLERQATMLKEMMLDSGMEKQMRSLMQLYLTHNLSALATLMNKEMQAEEVELLLNNRNLAWIPQLERIMKEQPAFVAVGAGHLPGEQGLIALLKAKGYKIKPVKLK